MKKYTIIFLLLFSCRSYCQLSATILAPPSGMMDKQQLWNILLANSSRGTMNLHIDLSFIDATTGEPVMSATTSSFDVLPGSKQLSADVLSPITYNILSTAYKIDNSPTGLLPIGTFNICYNFVNNGHNDVALQQCQLIEVPPLSPPTLITPDNESVLDLPTPLFSWLPPMPLDFFSSLQYDIKLVEINPNQSAADAIQQNVPVYLQHSILTNNLLYPATAPPLDSIKKYAWQITANNNLSEIGKSEIWMFQLKTEDSAGTPPPSDAMFIKMSKETEGYATFYNRIRLNYFNETSDTTFHVLAKDLTSVSSSSFVLPLDSVKLISGENLIEYDASADRKFINHHIYLLQVPNSRGEIWRLKFEYLQ